MAPRPTLVLVPTPFERDLLRPALGSDIEDAVRLELCGFGLVAAAARTADLLATRAPQRVVLVGIAGRLSDRLAIGAAYRFRDVACYGVGAGSAEGFIPAASLGWPQWAGESGASDEQPAAAAIGDRIACSPAHSPVAAGAGLLLSACAASATPEDVRQRVNLYPDAEAEDMEGFAVALACRLRGLPLAIIRGISNDAGDRDKARWQVGPALAAAAALVAQTLAEEP